MPDLENPFTDEQKKQMIEAIDKSNDLLKAITRAQSAGLDVGNQLQQATEARDRMLRVKQTYFPNG